MAGIIISIMGFLLLLITSFCCFDVGRTSDDVIEKAINFCLWLFGSLASVTFIVAGFSGMVKF